MSSLPTPSHLGASSERLHVGPRNLEAVVPEAGGFVHYWRDSGNPASAWNRTGVVTWVTGGACFITSDYTTNTSQLRGDGQKETTLASGTGRRAFR